MKILDDLLFGLKGRACPAKRVHTCVLWTTTIKRQCGPCSTLSLSSILFDCGIDAICAAKVVEGDKVIRSIGEGAMFKEVFGLRRADMDEVKRRKWG